MTSNQINRNMAEETARSNRARETETKRANKANERIADKRANTEIAKAVTGGIKDVGQTVGKFIFGHNDPAWYNMDKQLVKDVASISFNVPLGAPVDTNEKVKVKYPGILTLNWYPSIGCNGAGESSVANIAAKNIYAFVRHANSGRSNYEAVDLMLYILSVDQAYSYWASLCRIYSVINTAKSANRYWLDAMSYALGVDVADIRANISQLRAYINTMSIRLNSFYIPKDMPILNRHLWLNSNIFKDSEIQKSQNVLFLQTRFGYYDETSTKAGFVNFNGSAEDGALTFIPGKKITFAQLKAQGELLINKLIQSEDIGIMSGDILKAYGASNTLLIPSINEDFHIETVFSMEVLSQIENAILIGTDSYFSDFNITQNVNGEIEQGVDYYALGTDTKIGHGLLCKMGATTLTAALQDSYPFNFHVLNMYKDDVSPDDTMVATRFTAGIIPNVANKANGSEPMYAITDCGTEVAISVSVITLGANSQPNKLYEFSTLVPVTNSVEGLANSLAKLDCLVKFDWSPIVYLYNDTTNMPLANNRDIANYASISRSTLGNMHYVAVLSEYAVPMLGSTVRSR